MTTDLTGVEIDFDVRLADVQVDVSAGGRCLLIRSGDGRFRVRIDAIDHLTVRDNACVFADVDRLIDSVAQASDRAEEAEHAAQDAQNAADDALRRLRAARGAMTTERPRSNAA